MNPEIKARWLAALRSGEYKQGPGVLRNRDEDTYCCLGVLCELAVQEGVVRSVVEVGNCWIADREDRVRITGYDGATTVLPVTVSEWAGLDRSGVDSGNPWVLGRQKQLAQLNDEGYAFTELADVIEREL